MLVGTCGEQEPTLEQSAALDEQLDLGIDWQAVFVHVPFAVIPLDVAVVTQSRRLAKPATPCWKRQARSPSVRASCRETSSIKSPADAPVATASVTTRIPSR